MLKRTAERLNIKQHGVLSPIAVSRARRVREKEVNLAISSFLSGTPQNVGIGCRGNCHLHRLAAVQYAEHGKLPTGW